MSTNIYNSRAEDTQAPRIQSHKSTTPVRVVNKENLKVFDLSKELLIPQAKTMTFK